MNSQASQSCDSFFIYTEADVMSAVMSTYIYTKNLGFSIALMSEVSTSVSELATNVVKYACGGVVEISSVESCGKTGVKIVVKDSGTGIPDIPLALSDNFSTEGSLGLGLPGVKRMMDEFSIESSPEHGTKIVIVKWNSGYGL
ncbi:anti-sigma regulatory factor [Vibrio makurazakiensis]|uniref:anti-sigma regulatory factor n=1 Tax=Vibrio makurazakiensis TaxID=2910250 RepID=UPI003D14AF5D